MKTTKVYFLALVSFLFIIACSKDEEEGEDKKVYETAELTTGNYFAEKVEIDWLLNNSEFHSNEAYAFGNTANFQWEEGLEIFSIEVKRSSDESEINSRLIDLKNEGKYRILMVGSTSDNDILFLEIDQTQSPSAGNLSIRITNASADLMGIDVYIGGTTADHKVITNLEFKETSAYLTASVSDSNDAIIITNTGVDPNVDTNILTMTDLNSYSEMKVYHAIIAPSLTSSSKPHSFYTREE